MRVLRPDPNTIFHFNPFFPKGVVNFEALSLAFAVFPHTLLLIRKIRPHPFKTPITESTKKYIGS
jgi:hypothetical protein